MVFYRHTDVVNLQRSPTRSLFEELVKLIVYHDMKKVAVKRAEEHIKMNLEEYLERGLVKGIIISLPPRIRIWT